MRKSSGILTLQNISADLAANKNISRNRRKNQTICVTCTARPHDHRGTHRVNNNATTRPRRNVKTNRTFITRAFPGTVNRDSNLAKFNIQGRSIKRLVATLARRYADAIKIPLRQLDVGRYSASQLKARGVSRAIRHTFTSSRIVEFGNNAVSVRHSLKGRVCRLLNYSLQNGSTNVRVGVNRITRRKVTFLRRLLPTNVNIAVRRKASTTAVNTFRHLFQIDVRVRRTATLNSVIRRYFLYKEHRKHSPAGQRGTIGVLGGVDSRVNLGLTRNKLAVLVRVNKGFRARLILSFRVNVNR